LTTKEQFKDKPLKACISHLEEIAETGQDNTDAFADLHSIIKNLIKSNRLFDISSLYVFLKNAAANSSKVGMFFEPARNMLKENIKNLFTKSITYNNTELREMFSDILGNDTGLLIDLVSFIFNKYKLFGFTFSENINRQLVQIASQDLYSFIDHADIGFLAFYLSSLPKLDFVPKEHIEQLTSMILYKIDSQKQTAKLLVAMEEYPSADILLLFILSQRENDRLRALQILKDKLAQERSYELRSSFEDKAPYFIRTAITGGLFYDFHNIPLAHKELFAEVLKYAGIKVIKGTVIPLLRTGNPNGDIRITESKLAFVPVFKDLIPAFSDLVPELTKILRDEKIELEVKEEIRKVLIESK
jgi:hypothetical protein